MKRLELITDLGVLTNNAREIRKRVSPAAKLCCVIKADAYGHGAVPFAEALSKKGLCDAFAVATPTEGEALVRNGIREPIVVLGLPCSDEDATMSVKNGLHQAIDSISAAKALDDAAARIDQKANIHIKLDTGMHRIGVCSRDELTALLKQLRMLKHIRVSGLFTHFCAADEDELFTLEQLVLFREYRQIVLEAGFCPVCHAAASTAMLRSDACFDMVRAGIALYGTGVSALKGIVHPAQTLASQIISLRRVSADETVGYSRRFTAARESLIATIPCGYGDGYPRILSGRADVLIRGKRAPITGNICMDMLMCDVTDIPNVSVGDRAVLMGRMGDEAITPDELAKKAGTIPYEIMLGFSGRVYKSWINT